MVTFYGSKNTKVVDRLTSELRYWRRYHLFATGHITSLFDISRTTLSEWCKIFAPYLSATANPPKGAHRRYTDDDMGVFSLVHRLKRSGLTNEEIIATLASGQRDMMPEDAADMTPVAVSGQVRALQNRVSELENFLNGLRTERDEARGELKRANTEIDALKAEIRTLYREMARLEVQVDDDDK
jgi:DNA-binding transcriptional MerR regulator